MDNISIVPITLRDSDPRSYAYMYPSSIRDNNQKFIGFIKKLQRFNFYNQLKSIEDYAHKNGMLLMPAELLHWRRKKMFNTTRRIVVGKRSFYFTTLDELTDNEKNKLLDFAAAAQEVKI